MSATSEAIENAIINDDKDYVFEYIIKNGVNTEIYTGSTLLLFAVLEGTSDMVDMLIKHEANVNYQNSCNNTPLFCAIGKRNFEKIKLLLDAGASKEMTNMFKSTPIEHAKAFRCSDEIINLLEDRPPSYEEAIKSKDISK